MRGTAPGGRAARGSAGTLGGVVGILGIVGVLGTSLSAGGARAGECGVPIGAGAALAEQGTEARLRFLRESLRETARKERRFLIGWSITYAGFAGGSWVLVPISSDPNKRIDAIWSSSTAIAGALQNLIEPLRVMRHHRRTEELVSALGGLGGSAGLGGPGDAAESARRCQTLGEVERRLELAAKSETSARGPFAHIGGAVINVALGLVLAYGLKRPDTAASNTTIGLIVTELIIATRPTEAVRRLERYRAGDLDLRAPAPSTVELSPLIAPRSDGLSVGVAGLF
jgi:hypothetical protein